MEETAEELSEDISADVQLLLTVCHVVLLVCGEDPHGEDVAVKESVSHGMGVGIDRVGHHDEVGGAAELLHHALHGVGTAACRCDKIIKSASDVFLGQLLEICDCIELFLSHGL